MTVTSTEDNGAKDMPMSALVLGLGGLVPFVGLPLWQMFTIDEMVRERVVAAFIFYAASILSFLGGIGWGLAMRERDPVRRGLAFGVSVTPSLVAWAAAFVNVQFFAFSLGALGLAFALQGAWDVQLAGTGRAPRWFAGLRMVLTAVVLLAIAAMWIWRPPLSATSGFFL